MEWCITFRAVRGWKGNGLLIVRKPKDNNIKKRTDDGTKKKTYEEKSEIHRFIYLKKMFNWR